MEMLLSTAHDANEHRAVSTISSMTTVGDMRAALADVEAWATRVAAAIADPACFQTGVVPCLRDWIERTRHLLRKLPDESVAVEVSYAATAAMDEVASWSVHVAAAYGLDARAVPHVTDVVPGAGYILTDSGEFDIAE